MTASPARVSAVQAADNGDAFLGVQRSYTGRRWIQSPRDDRRAAAIAQQLGVPEILGRILAARGVGVDAAAAHLSPKLRDHLPDPSRLKDMDLAATRLARAVREGEGVAVFGDYDVDGAASVALLARFLRAVGHDALVYVPDRLREGYGPNTRAMARLVGQGARVIVTVDCGTGAVAPITAAVSAGADVIVVDHHTPGSELPPAYALVNPNRLDEEGTFGILAAVGVAFLLVVATNRALRGSGWYTRGRAEPDLLHWLDLVALGTVCDVVPLVGLNRAFVTQGLKVMRQRGNTGLAALSDVAGDSGAASAYRVGFVLGPRVNAGGRVGRAGLGAHLLTTEDAAEAKVLALELNGYNTERRTIEAKVLSEAEARIRDMGEPGPIILVPGERWHPGVIGIVANRLAELWRRPSVVLAIDGEVAKGSGRSVPGVDLGALVLDARDAGILIDGGGHPMAAGFAVETRRISELDAFLADRIGPRAVQAWDLVVDGAIAVAAANSDLVARIESAGPFGAGNPEPRFAVPSALVVKADIVGDRHVRAILDGGDGRRLKAIAFRSATEPLGHALLSARASPLHVAGHLRTDVWRGAVRTQLVVEDVAAPC